MITKTLTELKKPEGGKVIEIPADVFPVPRGGISHTESAEKIFRIIGENRRLFFRSAEGGAGSVVEVKGDAFDIVTPERFASVVEKFGHRVAAPEWDAKDKRFNWRTCTYGTNHATVALASDEARGLPTIRQLSACPIITPEGTVLQHGWHNFAGGTFIGDAGGVTEVPSKTAVEALRRLLEDFDFSTEADRARAIASLFSPALRAGRWIEDDFPLDVAEANVSQSGKTYRLQIVAAIYASKVSAVTMSKGGVGSLDETVSAKLIEGRPFIFLDNIRGRIDSQVIESAIRGTGSVQARAFRKSAAVDCRGFNWQLSTNGAELTPDLANRSIVTRIRKRPEGWKYREFPEGDLLRHVEEKQAFYLGCVFAVLREWLREGRPTTTESRHDFRAWCRALDWIVQNIFQTPPLLDGHREEQQRMASPELQRLRSIAVIAEADGRAGEEMTASDIAELIEGTDAELPPSNDKPSMAVGKMLGKIYRKAGADSVEVDGFAIARRVGKLHDGTEGLKTYIFRRSEGVQLRPGCDLESL